MSSPATKLNAAILPNGHEEAAMLLVSGKHHRARALLESLIASDASNAAAFNVLGLLELRQDRLDHAIAALERATQLDPHSSAAWRNLSTAHAARADWQSAYQALVKATSVLPADFELLKLLGKSASECKKHSEALQAYHRAHCLMPENRDCALGIARALKELGRHSGASEVLEAIIEEDPDDADARSVLAETYALGGKPHLVLRQREELFRLRPHSADAATRLSAAWWDIGDLAKSLEFLRPIVDANRASPELHSFYLTALVHQQGQSPASLRHAHERWGKIHHTGIEPFHDYPNDLDPNRKLRIAYIGGDFFTNPSYYFLLPYFRHHNREQFELYAYDLRDRGDAATEKFRSFAGHWISSSKWTDSQIIGRIRHDRIDILIDTTGHHEGNRLRLMRYRAAPIQLAMLNYPATTGLDCYDGIVADPWVCPPGLEAQYTERAIPIPSGYLPYDPPIEKSPAISKLPALDNGFITFGLFQRPVKLGPESWDSIASVLKGTPGSRLLVHNGFKHLAHDESLMRQHYLRELGSRGIAAERLRFEGPAGLSTHLEILAQCDIALDTFPYNGQTTTCECLWMGVPVVTVCGDYHAARVGSSILQRAGYPEWDAQSPSEYVEKACQLASDVNDLAATRQAMRAQLTSSLLLNGLQVTRELEDACRQLWIQRCRKDQDHGN